ncbi:MAG: A/G-specific adenine glycosylase [Verrucomicrobia bacterium]|jgi:A/G-specific adenine glycosylase|nr:A/G-specific adenine glycosylase [Verrucomicrobiota bacterium]
MRGETRSFRQRLLTWFDEHRRSLPWRTEPTLYKTVLSEFMLQQTRVETVLPYFECWLQRFPDFAALAAASEEEVLRQWEGLGYYARARNLHRLAKAVDQEGVPQDTEGWRRLPGIGPYTAAAIGSIAQGLPEPVIDGNVVRVLTRLQNDATEFGSAEAARRRFLPLARELIDPARPGAFNEALMELGATTCRKHRPDCLLCPVREFCEGHAAGRADSLPRLARKSTRRRTVARLFLLRDDTLLLEEYPADAPRLAGLAELPELPEPPPGKPVLTRTRAISSESIREEIHALSASHPMVKKILRRPGLRTVPLRELAAVSLSGPHRRWITALLAERKSGQA